MATRKNHIKLRDLPDQQYFCSIIGTCLTLKELMVIARKSKLCIDPSVCDYDLHGCFVSIAKDSSCYAHRQLQKHMDKKYAAAIREFSEAETDEALRKLWERALESADFAGAYYALVTHPAASVVLQADVFGEVHMLSHLSGASLRVDMQKHSILKRRVRKIEKELAEKTRLVLNKDEELQSLTKSLLTSVRSEERLRFQLAADAGSNKPDDLEKELTINIVKLDAARERNKVLVQKADLFQIKNASLEEALTAIKGQLVVSTTQRESLESNLSRVLDNGHVDSMGSYTNQDLCGRCILYVGGRSRQCRHFRQLVEKFNGRFIHHDGGIEDGDNRLASILSQADTVMCPLDCISHDAMNKVKRHCKIATKPLVMLPHASLSAFSKGLSEIHVESVA